MMENDVFLSVIIPCYNAKKYIGRCLDSLLNQTLPNEQYEIIVVDDASTDDTYELLCEYEKEHEEMFMIVHCEENGRQGRARNIALQYARGKYIGFVDADDWVEPERYEHLCGKALEYECDAVLDHYERATDVGELTVHAIGEDEYINMAKMDERIQYISGDTGLRVWAGIYRKSVMLENDIFFPEKIFYEDIFWGTLMSLYVKDVYRCREVYYHYYVNEDATTASSDVNNITQKLTIELLLVEELKRRKLWDAYKEVACMWFVQRYYINALYMLSMNCQNIPLELCGEMKQTVTKLFPDYASNLYYKKRLETATTETKHLLHLLSCENIDWNKELALIVQFETLSKLLSFIETSSIQEVREFVSQEIKQCVLNIELLAQGMEQEYVDAIQEMKREISA